MKHINLKSIFATFLLLVGVCQVSWGYDWSEGKTLYFDNSKTKWTDVYIIIGKSDYCRAYKMVPVENSTLYSCTMGWGGYTYFVVSSSIGTSSLNGQSGKNIDDAIQTCTSRTDKFSKSISSDVLIEVTGSSSPYTIQQKTTFNLDDYATNLPITLPTEKKVSNLILFNTATPVLGAWLWHGDNDNDKTYSTTVTGSANGTTLSYRDNSTNSFKSAIGFKCSVTDGGSWPGDQYKETGDITSDGTYTDGNRYYHKDKGNKFLQFTHISSNFSVKVSGSTIAEALSGATLTLEASNTTGTLYTDGGNNAKYAFYVKTADGTITRLQSFSTFASTNYTTPATSQTITLYCYVQDLYGLETIQYTKDILITTTTTIYTVTFNVQGHGTAPAAQTVNSGEKATKPADPTATGYTFGGWYTNTACTDAYDFNAAVTKDITLYAKWTEKPTTYTVTYNYNYNGATDTEATYTVGGAALTLPTPTREGYTFNGWYTAATGGTKIGDVGASYTPTNNITLYAQWTANTTNQDTVFFVNQYNWQTVKIHLWNGTYESTQYPGVDMTKADYKLKGADVYYYTVSQGATGKCLFNCGSDQCKTGDLTFTAGKYYYNDTWMTRAELETEPAQEIYVQGRFRVRKTKEGDDWNFTGNYHGDWNNSSTKIKFEYDADKKLYKLNTYCSVAELSDGNNQNPYFYFTIGGTTYGAETDGMAPSLSSSKNKITKGTHSFQFSDACEGGYNVVLYIDWENKQFWYEKEGTVVSIPYYGLDGFGGDWNNSKLLRPNDDGTQATCTLTFNSRGPQSFGIRQWKSSSDSGKKAWWWCASGTTIRRNNCTGIKFKKEGEYAGQNPTLVVDAIGDYVFTYTYADSTLTVTYPEKVVTPQKYKLYGDFYGTGWKEYEGSWNTDLTEGEWTLEDIPEGGHMFMLKAADGNLYFNAEAGAATIQRENPSVYVDNEYSSDDRENITLNADEAGTYKFTLDFTHRLITVTYPGNIKIKYRMVYAEQKSDGTYEKYHPSTPYINAVAEDATDERRDTVSLHIRCSIPDYHRNSLEQIDRINKYDPNPNSIYVYLQKWDGTKWETTETMALQENARIARESGVYNFVVVQDPQASENKVYIDPNIEPYKGNYYIRTNVAPGRWNNYKQIGNQITYSDYAAQHKHFEYYWCKWVDMNKTDENLIRDGMANLKFTIANDYSNCVSDTCLNELDNRKFTVNGRLGSNANVRWMWHSKTNDIDRAYVAGKNANLFLVNKGGTINGEDKGTFGFEDRENWTYKIELTATPKAKFAITKKPHDGAGDQRYWVVGNETEGVTLIEGEGRDTYRMCIVYDFKSDHLIYAWVPDDTTDISASIDLGAAVVCMRKDNHNATQVRITPAETTLSNVQEALGVLSLTKKEFFDKPAGWNTWEREYYWISFPFNVNVSDIFSTFVYDRDYIIQEYDGASRAANGCWADSPSYWRNLSKADKMEAGKGYVLYISHDTVKYNNVYGNNPTELNIYFPSTGVTKITGEIQSVDVPKHTCTITRNNRDIYDSNWNLIGVPTWVNIEGMADGPEPGEQPENKNVSNIITNDDNKTVGFYYHFNTGTEDGKPGNTWTPRNVKEEGDQLVFKNIRSYLIQWAGTINWTNQSWEETPSAQSLQARRAAEAKPEEYTLRLELSRGETALDQTFVRLQEDGDVTADYDMNYDMTKIINPGANLYSLIGTNLIQAGANVLPLPAENTTVYVPVGVVADKDGMYRFSMPDGTEGMTVLLADYETGMTYNLALGDYEVSLTKGTYEQRFTLEIQSKKGVTTGCNESTTDDGTLRKVLIDGNLYIQRGDALYDAAGRAL